MTRLVFAIPGDIDLPTGGYTYDRRVLGLLAQFGIEVVHLQLPAGYPAPSAGEIEATSHALADVPPEDVLMIDGLAYGAMPTSVIRRASCPIIALVHHPLCLETGLPAARQDELRRSETAALSFAHQVIATSATTAQILQDDFGVASDLITVAEPGTDPAPRATGSSGGTVQLLAVGSIVPRKGYDVLLDALAKLPADLDWQLAIAGAEDRSPETAADIKARLAAPIGRRVRLLGAVPEPALAEIYAGTDVFVLASHYEGYGMVLTEALARGLPIITTRCGMGADAIPDAAVVKVAPGDVEALATALQCVISDATLRRAMGDAAWAAAQTSLPRWQDTAAKIAGVIKELAP
jgi:glycosyltransferase involved in cell wall biosynthesis